MTKEDNPKSLTAIKAALQKIAQDIQTPDEQAAADNSSPEAVMELVTDAIDVLETAAQAIPSDDPREAPPDAGAPAAVEAPKKPMAAKQKQAQDGKDEKKDDNEDDDEKKEMMARLATLEEENTNIKKAKIADEIIEFYPEHIRQAKWDEIVGSKDPVPTLERDLKVAKEVFEGSRNQRNYTPATSQSGYLNQLQKKAKQQGAEIAPWKV